MLAVEITHRASVARDTDQKHTEAFRALPLSRKGRVMETDTGSKMSRLSANVWDWVQRSQSCESVRRQASTKCQRRDEWDTCIQYPNPISVPEDNAAHLSEVYNGGQAETSFQVHAQSVRP